MHAHQRLRGLGAAVSLRLQDNFHNRLTGDDEVGYCLHAYEISHGVVFSLQGESCSIGDFGILLDRDPAHHSANITH